MLNHIKSPRTQVARKKSSAQAGRRGSKIPLTTPRRAKPWRSPCRRELRRPTCSRRPAKMTDTVPYLSRISHPTHHTLEKLVLSCIGTNLCSRIRIFPHFSRSTKLPNVCTSWTWTFLAEVRQTVFAFFVDFLQNYVNASIPKDLKI